MEETKKPVTVPRYIGVLCERNKPSAFFGGMTLDELFDGTNFRQEINRVTLTATGYPQFPKYVAALATTAETIYEGSDNSGELQGKFSRAWAEEIQRHEAAGGSRTDEQSPCYDIYEFNSELEFGACWRIYTESKKV